MSRTKDSWAWYIIRGSGLTAAVLLVLLMISGIGMVTGLTYKVLSPLKAWVVHKALGIALGVAVLLHVFTLLFDHYVSFSIWQILVPFLSTYSNHTTIFGLTFAAVGVALGVLSLYGLAVVILSSLGWIETRQSWWKFLHYLSYFVFAFVFIHALQTGTDLKAGFLRAIWLIFTLIIVVMIISRLMRSGTLKEDPTDDNS